jgi:hypothetical protein
MAYNFRHPPLASLSNPPIIILQSERTNEQHSTSSLVSSVRGSARSGSVVGVLVPVEETTIEARLLRRVSILHILRSGVARERIIHASSRKGGTLVSAPEAKAAAAIAGGVVVRGGWAETLLSLVVTGEKDLEENGEEEKEAGSDFACQY